MKQSARAKRLARHHKRFNTGTKLNLVSLMDIFTILVFFLIVNQSEVRVLQNINKVSLPVSLADELPSENIVVTVLSNTVLVQERAVWQQSEHLNSVSESNNEELAVAIKNELNYLASKRVELSENEKIKGRPVTIIGDETVPYKVLKQIMAACAESDFRNVSLAVKQIQSSNKGED